MAAAESHITRGDPVMAHLARLAGPFRLAKPTVDHFQALAESILYQQLAGAAAAAIHRRFVALFDGSLTPEAVAGTSIDRLRSAGLSGSKATSIQDLASKVADGTVPLAGIERLSDEEIVQRLSLVRGIGRWTAEMFLIFQLRRLDVWPVDDYGVRQGYALAYGLPVLPKPKELAALGERFRPYRTVPAWYCWRAVHLSRSAGWEPFLGVKPGRQTTKVVPAS
jgi:DNA-3-methyladenine glycosylase II